MSRERCTEAGCDRLADHPGVHMARCGEGGCTEPLGHRKHHTTGTFNSIGWFAGVPVDSKAKETPNAD